MTMDCLEALLRSRRRFLRRLLGMSACSALLSACQGGGNFCLFGYSTQSLYNPNYKTIFVPIFKNKTYRRNLEFDLTRVVIREIEVKIGWKAVPREMADTELLGTITTVGKNLTNINQENEVRDADVPVNVEVLWREVRTGKVLSKPSRPRMQVTPGINAAAPLNSAGGSGNSTPGTSSPGSTYPGQGGNLVEDINPPYRLPDEPPPGPTAAPMVGVQAVDHYIPELGQSTATALQGSMNRLATQIVSMMETAW